MNAHANYRSQIASHIFLLRSQKGLSLEETAKQSGISRATLSRIENAEVSPTADTLCALCATFDIPVSRLIAMTEQDFDAFIKFDNQAETIDQKTGFTRRSISPPSPDLLAYVEENHLPPDRNLEINQNTKSAQETHIILLDGALSIHIDQQEHDLTAGDCVRYKQHSTVVVQTPPTRGARFLKICV